MLLLFAVNNNNQVFALFPKLSCTTSSSICHATTLHFGHFLSNSAPSFLILLLGKHARFLPKQALSADLATQSAQVVQVMASFDKDERKLKNKTREVALLRSSNTLAQERVQELNAQVREYGTRIVVLLTFEFVISSHANLWYCYAHVLRSSFFVTICACVLKLFTC